VADTVKHLQMVAEKEGVTVDANALNVIAQKSDGGMRDALSIFDQIVSFCGTNISYQGVIDNLNVLDYEFYFRLVEAFLRGDISQSLLIFNEILNKGFDAHHFITGLSSHLRDVLVSKDPATVQLLEVGADIGKRYQTQAQQCSPEFLIQALRMSNDCDLNYRISKNKRLLVELTLIKLSQLNDEKKKHILSDEVAPQLKKISPEVTEVTAVQQPAQAATIQQPQSPQHVPPASRPVQTVDQSVPTTKPLNNTASVAPSVGFKRPASISITKPQQTTDPQSVSNGSAAQQQVIQAMAEDFSDTALENAWREFGASITDDVKQVNFQTINLPVRISASEFEVSVNNVMQENELKKIQTDIVQFVGRVLRNTTLRMKIRLIEESEMQKTLSPEEKYKQMVEQNPLLDKLRKNLQMEID
jgi:DNA polymerase-3 subunit gamma/tau